MRDRRPGRVRPGSRRVPARHRGSTVPAAPARWMNRRCCGSLTSSSASASSNCVTRATPVSSSCWAAAHPDAMPYATAARWMPSPAIWTTRGQPEDPGPRFAVDQPAAMFDVEILERRQRAAAREPSASARRASDRCRARDRTPRPPRPRGARPRPGSDRRTTAPRPRVRRAATTPAPTTTLIPAPMATSSTRTSPTRHPSGTKMLNSTTTNTVNDAWPDHEVHRAGSEAGEEHHHRQQHPEHALVAPDRQHHRRRDREADDAAGEGLERGGPGSQRGRAQHGERAEDGPERVLERCDLRDQHRGGEPDARARGIAEPHRAQAPVLAAGRRPRRARPGASPSSVPSSRRQRGVGGQHE